MTKAKVILEGVLTRQTRVSVTTDGQGRGLTSHANFNNKLGSSVSIV